VYLPEFRPAIANCTWASEYAFGTRKFTFIVEREREMYVRVSASDRTLPQVGHYTMDYVKQMEQDSQTSEQDRQISEQDRQISE
jgi:hypothetical protein